MKRDRSRGIVFLVGAGPGDPGLITLKGMDCLKAADVVIYDYLANKRLLDYTRPGTEHVYVGKRSGTAPGYQEHINGLLVTKAREGKTVVRLKGGDPVLFGRGAEEAETLADAHIPFEIVPGVTSATAVPAYAGIPITHRLLSSSVAIVTGHENSAEEGGTPPWEALAAMQTVVFLMGVRNLGENMARLIDAGRDPGTPAALISWGTVPRQRTVVGTIGTLAAMVRESGIKPPSVVVVGEVVGLRAKINWFETKPLFGRRVLVTRSRAQAGVMAHRIESAGGEAIELPTIEIIDPPDWDALDSALRELSTYDWLVFTSVNGVEFFFRRLLGLGMDLRSLHGTLIAAIGEQTAAALSAMGIVADLVPDDYRAEGLVEALRERGVKGSRILIPRALEAREMLPGELGSLGGDVTVAPAYQAIRPEPERAAGIARMVSEGEVDAVTFASSSTARNFFELTGLSPAQMGGAVIACIGPVTAETVRSLGHEPAIVCTTYTIERLINDLSDHFSGQGG